MNRFLIVAAYYLIASRYHSGQGSKGYQKLCQADRLIIGTFKNFAYDKEIRDEAARLLWKKRREIKREW